MATMTHGSTAATGQEDPLTASGGGASGSSDPHHASHSPMQQENIKLKTHHNFETLATAVRVFKVLFVAFLRGRGRWLGIIYRLENLTIFTHNIHTHAYTDGVGAPPPAAYQSVEPVSVLEQGRRI